MKRTITTISMIALFVAVFCCTVSAKEVNRLSFGYHYSANYATVYGCNITDEGELNIPAMMKGLPVYAIESDGFDDYAKITKLNIPNPITVIGSGAFSDCVQMEEIKISSSVKHVGKDAFLNSGYYNNINNWDESGALYIDDVLIKVKPLFAGKFIVKEGTRLIADNAFEGCKNITEVSIPDTVECVGKDVFVDSGVCENASNWTGDALYIDKWLVAVKDTNTFELETGVNYIADDAFQCCDAIEEVVLPEGVLRIGAYAFWGCSALARITIPSTVEYIGKDAFTNCSLKEIVVHPDNKKYIAYNGILYTKNLDTAIRCPQQEDGTVTLANETQYIADDCFSGCVQIENIVLPSSLEGIGDSAFSECRNVNQFLFPKTLKRIGRFAFANCSKIKAVVIPDSVEIIGENSFSRCLELKRIQIGKGVTEIKTRTFERCEKLNEVILPDGIQEIGDFAFYETALLENRNNYDEQGLLCINKCLVRVVENNTGIYHIPERIALIATDCFEDCFNVNHIVLPKSLKRINNYGLRVEGKIQKITYYGTATQWHDVSNTANIEEYPEEGIRMLSDIPIIRLVIINIVIIVAMIFLWIINREIRKEER